MKKLPEIILKNEGNFIVVRDDLLEGGTKRRVLTKLIASIKENEIVYPAHAYGYGQYALALAAKDFGKKVTLLYPDQEHQTNIFSKTSALSNVTTHILEGYAKQGDVVTYAAHYAERCGAYLFPIGFNTPTFLKELVEIAKSLTIEPSEVWVLGGSGTLARALCKAWPAAKVNVVDLGMGYGDMGPTHVIKAPEAPEEKAKTPPPYPSAEYYDAKIWQFASKFGSKGALIWNVA